MSDEQNPYLKARREWDERYGDQVTRAHNWRKAAFSAFGVAALAVLGIAYIGAQSKIQPYVVSIDSMGNPIAIAQPSTGGAVSERIVEAQVANWVWEWRSFLPDPKVQKQMSQRVYALIGTDVAAELNPWYEKAWVKNAGKTVEVHISSVLPVAKNTYQVNWVETHYQNGQSLGQSYWKANVIVGFDKKLTASPQVLITNPLGLYIKSLTWTAVSEGVAQ
ncbi:type IV secretion system protein [Acidithiobacillus sp. HP-6]|uniref:VirB8/TrbF family protein n=1 Tax=unclassified Acidithiobacillus TaxID=2614800 RepID=UPI00187A42DF|nr:MULTISPECIES: VirB8/TrbF family protein [unclassified Acidithiobacillus]MBE7564306.1 type IV secretion system protein [Acidithiobacillus sp. HP-6]MBE7571002.1 type IV secretion system protein [Acidithiobacillus sp. HP-2]